MVVRTLELLNCQHSPRPAGAERRRDQMGEGWHRCIGVGVRRRLAGVRGWGLAGVRGWGLAGVRGWGLAGLREWCLCWSCTHHYLLAIL